MKYDFDEIINRQGTDALNFDGWRQYIFKADSSTKFPFKDEEYIRMWVADMDFSTPPEILSAIKARLDKKILGYTKIYDNQYYDIFTDWCKRRYDWEINSTEIVLSPGIIPALNRLVPLLTKQDEGILILTPSYTPFKQAGDYSGRQVTYSDLTIENGRYQIDFADVEAKIKDPSLNIKLFILSNPHNPTGRVWTEQELNLLGKLCLDNDIWIISDEIHCDLLRQGQHHIPLAKLFPETDKIVTCMAPSKTFNLAGNLISHIFIKNNEIKQEWLRLYDDFISPLSLVATKSAYSECDEWLEQLKVYLDNNFEFVRNYLQQHLPKIEFTIPESTYLAWINIEPYLAKDIDRTQLSLYFATHSGVLIEGGNMFVSNGDGYIRINLACPQSVIAEGLQKIKNTVL